MGRQPWSAAEATDRLRVMARDPDLELGFSTHARERILERGMTATDVIWVLRNGFVDAPPRPGRDAGTYRYEVEGLAPSANSRTIRAVVVPDWSQRSIFVVTVMWVDRR